MTLNGHSRRSLLRSAPCQSSPAFEPRARWPRRLAFAKPQPLVKGQPGAVIDMTVNFVAGRRHLPRVTLNRAA